MAISENLWEIKAITAQPTSSHKHQKWPGKTDIVRLIQSTIEVINNSKNRKEKSFKKTVLKQFCLKQLAIDNVQYKNAISKDDEYSIECRKKTTDVIETGLQSQIDSRTLFFCGRNYPE